MRALGPWFEVNGKRLEQELQALTDIGIEHEVNGEARAKGKILMRLELPDEDWTAGLRTLRVFFPDLYPYFRPIVFTAEGAEIRPRHHHPLGNLCLLPRDTAEWDVDKTLAAHLKEQLPKWDTASQASGEEAAAESHEQAEPYSDYYQYGGGLVLLDSTMAVPRGVGSGTLTLGLSRDSSIVEPRAAVFRFRKPNGALLCEGNEMLSGLFPDRIGVQWVRLDQPPPVDWRATHAMLTARGLIKPPHELHKVNGGRMQLIGICFAEERGAPDEYGDGWVFMVQAQKNGASQQHFYWCRARFYDREVLYARIPELGFLSGQTIAVAGTGCIGSTMAGDLARSGVAELRLLDGDDVDPGTTVRWALGLPSAGRSKVQSLKAFLESHYPLVRVKTFPYTLGEIGGDLPQWEAVRDFASGAHALIDATAEMGVHYYLSVVARELAIPYVTAAATQGAWGGTVFRGDPAGPCWLCLQHRLQDGGLPEPPSAPDSAGRVQPPGCANPTYTGAPFDLAQVAHAAVQLAVATLSGGAPSYPTATWNYGVGAFRDAGEPIVASWERVALAPHPRCPLCHPPG